MSDDRDYYVVRSWDGERRLTARTEGGAREMVLRWDGAGHGPCTVEFVRSSMDRAARNVAFALGLVAAIELGVRVEWLSNAHDAAPGEVGESKLRQARLWLDDDSKAGRV